MITNQIIEDLEKIYHDKPHRLLHVYGVRDTAINLGITYDLDVHKIEVAALLHDITKYENSDVHKNIIQSYFDNAEEILTDYNPNLWHAFSAVAIANTKYQIDDPIILGMIQHHTIGKENMNLYEAILFISDYTEPGRKYDSSIKVREILKKDLTLAVFTAMDDSIKLYTKLGHNIPSAAYQARTFYKQKLEVQNEKN